MTAPRPHIAAMAPYALANLSPPDGKDLVSLSQNESLRPPSPKATEAAALALEDGNLYPDPDWSTLRRDLAQQFDLQSETILCGTGSLDLIGCIARAFAGPNRAILAPAHAYPFFRTAAQMVDARFDAAEEDNLVVSVDALLNAVQPDTRIVFVANPANPTGTRLPKSELLRLRAGLRAEVLLIIDEAYGEFADHLNETCFDMVQTGATVVLRTFSKAYGLAGLRVGWGVFPADIASHIRKVMNPNNISQVAQVAACAALADQAYMRETCAQTARLRDMAVQRLRGAGFTVLDSYTNFVLVLFTSNAAAQNAEHSLQAEGVFARRQAGVGLPNALRITIGPEKDLRLALDLLIERASP